MEMKIRLATREEKLYCYKNSLKIFTQVGFIGHLRGDFGKSGKQFFSKFFDFNITLKSEAFNVEFDNVINALRGDPQYGGLLTDLASMSSYCAKSEPLTASTLGKCFTCFRIDTEDYTYMLRCFCGKDDYNFYVYCYQKVCLTTHMENAKRGIRFFDSNYKEMFRIADGDSVRLISVNGNRNVDAYIRYIDEYHLESNHGPALSIYHSVELTNLVEKFYQDIIPLRASLPDSCLSVHPDTQALIRIEKGVDGYEDAGMPIEPGKEAREAADRMSQALGITKAQEAAMVAGAMVGWASPLADPANYEDDGSPRPCIAKLYSDREAEVYPDIRWEVQTLNDRDEVLTANTFDGEDENKAWEFYHRLTGPKAFIKVDADGEPIEELAYIKN